MAFISGIGISVNSYLLPLCITGYVKMEFKLFKIWDVTRSKKCFIKIDMLGTDDVLEKTILKGNF